MTQPHLIKEATDELGLDFSKYKPQKIGLISNPSALLTEV